MVGGLESRCVGRVCGAGGSVARHHPHRTHVWVSDVRGVCLCVMCVGACVCVCVVCESEVCGVCLCVMCVGACVCGVWEW
jgi:hypothetical protein